MNYEEVRNIAKDGDVLFFHKNKNIGSKIISFFTKSKYTHVGFLFWYKDRLMLVDSGTVGGTRITLASTHKDNTFDIIPAPKKWSDIEDKALAKAGTSFYGWFSAFYVGLREVLFVHFNISLPPNNKNRNKCCSELVAEVLELPDPDISPRVLYQILTSTHAYK